MLGVFFHHSLLNLGPRALSPEPSLEPHSSFWYIEGDFHISRGPHLVGRRGRETWVLSATIKPLH